MMHKNQVEGYLSVYLALCLTVMLSLFFALLEGVRDGAIRVESACIVDIGLNSVMAEYHRELLSQFNIFAIDSSYGSSSQGREYTQARLQAYIERNASTDTVLLSTYLYRDFLGLSVSDVEITKVQILSDGDGALFRQLAVEAIKDDVGLDLLTELVDQLDTVEEYALDTRDIEAEKAAADSALESFSSSAQTADVSQETDADEDADADSEIDESHETSVTIVNPTSGIETAKSAGILKLVLKDADSVSTNSVVLEDLIFARISADNLNQGNIEVEDTSTLETLTQRFLFQEYLLRYLGNYAAQKDESALSYEIEYLICGKDNDTDNLKGVATRLLAIRCAADAVYLYADETKTAQAEVIATVLTTLLLVPEAAEAMTNVLLLGWATAEGIYDVKTLFAGGSIPLMKDSSSWHYSLEGILSSWTNADTGSSDDGLNYQAYLRILMSLTSLDTITYRAMDMVEADIRQTDGNTYFRLDACYTQIEAEITINSSYGYTNTFTGKKSYE